MSYKTFLFIILSSFFTLNASPGHDIEAGNNQPNHPGSILGRFPAEPDSDQDISLPVANLGPSSVVLNNANAETEEGLEVPHLNPNTAQELQEERGMTLFKRYSRAEIAFIVLSEFCNYGSYFILALGGWLPIYDASYQNTALALVFAGTILKPGESYFKNKAKKCKKAITKALESGKANQQDITPSSLGPQNAG